MKPDGLKENLLMSCRKVNFLSTARQAAEALQKGSLVIIPTDTVYGITADPRVPGAVERLYEAKGRDKSKPIPLLAASITEVEKYGAIFGELERRLAERFWPGPLTLVLEVTTGNQNSAFGNRHSNEGFRVPDCEITLAVLRETGGILRVTSANRSGEPPALTAEEAIRYLESFVDAVLDAGAVSGGTPSTVVKVENGKIQILRKGAIGSDQLSVISDG